MFLFSPKFSIKTSFFLNRSAVVSSSSLFNNKKTTASAWTGEVHNMNFKLRKLFVAMERSAKCTIYSVFYTLHIE